LRVKRAVFDPHPESPATEVCVVAGSGAGDGANTSVIAPAPSFQASNASRIVSRLAPVWPLVAPFAVECPVVSVDGVAELGELLVGEVYVGSGEVVLEMRDR
jgi:hypothetical protein